MNYEERVLLEKNIRNEFKKLANMTEEEIVKTEKTKEG